MTIKSGAYAAKSYENFFEVVGGIAVLIAPCKALIRTLILLHFYKKFSKTLNTLCSYITADRFWKKHSLLRTRGEV